MKTAASGGTGGCWNIRKTELLAGVCSAALAMACALPAQAADYEAANDAQLRQAIIDANADGDPNATIRLTQGFTLTSGALPTPTKPMTIDTQGFTLSAPDDTPAPPGAGGQIQFSSGTGGTVRSRAHLAAVTPVRQAANWAVQDWL